MQPVSDLFMTIWTRQVGFFSSATQTAWPDTHPIQMWPESERSGPEHHWYSTKRHYSASENRKTMAIADYNED